MTYQFESDISFAAEGVEAVVVYCSDGRFGRAFEQFVEQGLKLKRYDRLVLPGGPAVLAGCAEEPVWQRTAEEAIGFLVRAHWLRRIILIAHDDCGFYKHRLGVPADRVEEKQIADLRQAAKRLQEQVGIENIERYLARICHRWVTFEQRGEGA